MTILPDRVFKVCVCVFDRQGKICCTIWMTQAATGKNWEVTSAMTETGRVTTAATVAGAVEAGAARRRSQETLGAALEMVVPEVTVKAEVVVVVAVVNLEEHELHLHTNSW